MSKQKKKLVKKPVQVIAKKEAVAKLWNEYESWLYKNSRYLLGGLIIAAAIFKAVYFIQLNKTPLINLHEAKQTDMHFFDKWAKHLAYEDWLQHSSYSNFTQAHRWVSDAYLNKHPEKIDELKKQIPAGSDNSMDAYGKLLFKSWFGDKVYFQEPFYVYVVATFYKVFGPDIRFVFIFQMLIGIGSIILIYLIAKTYFGNIAAMAAGLIALLHGPLLFYDLILLRESLIVFTGLLLVYNIGHTLKNKSATNLFISGVIIGISILIKSIFAIFGVLFLILIVYDTWIKKQKNIKGILLPVAGILAGLLPLIIRNIIVGIPPFSISSTGAFSFITCNYYGYDPITAFAVSPSNADVLYKTNGAFLPSVVETIKTFPAFSDFLLLIWQKFKLLFLWTEIPNNKSFYYYKINAPVLSLAFIGFSLIAAMGISGIVLSFFKKEKPFGLYLLFFTHFAVLLGFLVLSRYRIPFTTALIPFCGLTVSELIKKAELKDFRLILILVPSVILFFVVNRPMPPGLIPLRSSDYAMPYHSYYKPRIDSALKHNQPAVALKEMRAFLKLTPAALENINANMTQADDHEVNVASFYGDVYNTYALIADANELKDMAILYRTKSDELKNISYRFGKTVDPYNMIYKARLMSDPAQKKALLEQGVKELQLRLKADPNDFGALATLADVMLDDLRDHVQFEYYIKAALKVQPDHAKAQFKLGHYYFQTGKNLDEASVLVSNSLKGWPDNSQAYTELGYYYALQNKIDMAANLWQKAVAINPADCTAVDNLRKVKNLRK